MAVALLAICGCGRVGYGGPDAPDIGLADTSASDSSGGIADGGSDADADAADTSVAPPPCLAGTAAIAAWSFAATDALGRFPDQALRAPDVPLETSGPLAASITGGVFAGGFAEPSVADSQAVMDVLTASDGATLTVWLTSLSGLTGGEDTRALHLGASNAIFLGQEDARARGGVSTFSGGSISNSRNGTFRDLTTVFLAMSYNSVTGQYLFQVNAEQSPRDHSGQVRTNEPRVHVGHLDGANILHGEMHHAAIYDRGLSAAELTCLFEGGQELLR